MISALYDPLFQAVRMDGSKVTLGLKPLLIQAHTLKDLSARTPTGRCALMRLCIAFLTEVYKPRDAEARREIFESGAFDGTRIEEYIQECEANGPRFLLDDERHPFMQAAYEEKLDAKALKPVAALFADLPSGNNHIHLEHRLQDEYEMDADQAFEAMMETYLFCPASLLGPSGCNNTPPLYALLRGRSLFETLALNMVSVQELGNIPLGEGEVPWRMETVIQPRKQVNEISFLQALTWQPRRLTLIFDADGKVRKVYLQAGLDFRGNSGWEDPHVSYFLKKDGTWGTLKPELGRQVWRDAGMLMATRSTSERPPIPVTNLGDVWWDPDENWKISMDVIGMITDQATLMGWLHERLVLPQCLLCDESRAEEFKLYVQRTNELHAQVKYGIDKLIYEIKKGTSSIAQQAGELFLQEMHEFLFGRCLEQIMDQPVFGQERQGRLEDFWKKAWYALNDVWIRVVEKSGFSIREIKRQNQARGWVMHEYKRLREKDGVEWKKEEDQA